MKKAVLCLMCLAYGLIPSDSHAFGWEGNAEIFGAHRKDRITALTKAFDSPDILILTDNLVAKNIHVIEGGLRGKFALCNGFFIKGFGSLGKINHGIFNENIYDGCKPTTRARAKTNHGDVQDYSLALGYQYSLIPCWRAGFSVGWASDFQNFKLSHAYFKIPDPISHSGFDKKPAFIFYGLRYKNRWQGPWVGLETRLSLPCITLDLGYEFHWVHWHAQWRLKNCDAICCSFSDRRKSDQSFGNVGFINLTYNFFRCWTIAIGARYQYFKAINGRVRPLTGSFSSVGLNETEVDKVRKATWQSFAMQLFLGYSF